MWNHHREALLNAINAFNNFEKKNGVSEVVYLIIVVVYYIGN